MNNLEGEQANPWLMRPVHLLLMLVVLAPLTGCLGGGDGGSETTGTYIVESSMTAVEVEAKSAYYVLRPADRGGGVHGGRRKRPEEPTSSESSMTAVEVTKSEIEAKSAYYQDGGTVEWSVDSSAFSEAIEAAGGNVVGVLFSLSYGEDETSGGPLCTGGEANAPDTITGGATKGEWTLSGSEETPGLTT